jgi:deoxyribodipyrimidine photolyase
MNQELKQKLEDLAKSLKEEHYNTYGMPYRLVEIANEINNLVKEYSNQKVWWVYEYQEDGEDFICSYATKEEADATVNHLKSRTYSDNYLIQNISDRL